MISLASRSSGWARTVLWPSRGETTWLPCLFGVLALAALYWFPMRRWFVRAAPSIADYDERRAKQLEFWRAQNGQQTGDPAKLARALITIASQEPPPLRFIAGADAIGTAEQKVADLKAQIDANRELSTSLAFD